MRTFFPLPRGDRWYLAALLAIAMLAFTPWARATEVGALPLFGWLMAALMVLSPLIALLRLLSADRRDASRSGR